MPAAQNHEAEPPVESAPETTNPPTPPAAAPRSFRFTVPVRLLREVLPALRPLAGPKSTLPILNCVLITRELGSTSIGATNLDQALLYTMPSETPPATSALGKKLEASRSAREDGSVAIPFTKLQGLLKSADAASDITIAGSTDITQCELLYRLVGQPSKASAEFMDPTEFPPFPEPKGYQPSVALPPQISTLLTLGMPSISNDSTRYVLNGAYLHKEKNRIETADGKSMTIVDCPLPIPESIILPTEAIKLLTVAKTMGKLPWRFATAKKAKDLRARFEAGPWTLHTKVIEGNYPNVDAVINDQAAAMIKNEPIYLSVNVRSQFKDLIDRLPAEKPDTVKLEVQNGLLRFSTKGGNFTLKLSENHRPRAVLGLRELWKQLFALNCTEMFVRDEQSPIVGRAKGIYYVFMPMRP